jgi:hypothetical protein
MGELVEVAREERAHELALAEDAAQSSGAVDDRQRRQIAAKQLPHGLVDAVFAAQYGRVTPQQGIAGDRGDGAGLLERTDHDEQADEEEQGRPFDAGERALERLACQVLLR